MFDITSEEVNLEKVKSLELNHDETLFLFRYDMPLDAIESGNQCAIEFRAKPMHGIVTFSLTDSDYEMTDNEMKNADFTPKRARFERNFDETTGAMR